MFDTEYYIIKKQKNIVNSNQQLKNSCQSKRNKTDNYAKINKEIIKRIKILLRK